MRKELFILNLFFTFGSLQFYSSASAIYANNKTTLFDDTISTIKLNHVTVIANSSTNFGKSINNTTNVANKDLIKTANHIPQIIQTLPSVVAFTEDGSGVGNTSIRIRGTDATRINVSINGMPLNNPESQEVYWVNLPGIANSLQKIEVTRGVGSSTSGTSSFGGSIAMVTEGGKPSAYGQAALGLGSYNTFTSTLAAGSGLINNTFSIDGRYTKTLSDGYIRNAKVNHQNAYVALSHYKNDQLIRLNYINGIQHTGITWEGVSPNKMKEDRRYNPAGEYKDDAGNILYYNNETDNYYSNIVQISYINNFSNSVRINAGSSYNHGYGYYENYKMDRNLDKTYHIAPQIINGMEYKSSNVIQRKLLFNNFYTLHGNIDYTKNKLYASGGVYGSLFDGDHYGRLKWVKYNEDIPKNYEWFRNSANKNEFNLFTKASYSFIPNLSVIGDIQYRFVEYKMRGIDDDFANITNNQYYRFFNPKIGISFSLNGQEIYASWAMTNREPLRTDLKESIKGGNKALIKPERLFDYELGYKYVNEVFSANINLYYMDYRDQMLQTGKLNDVGYKLMENVPNSYRMGIEFIGAYKATNWFRLDANLTLSRNKIKDYTTYFDLYDNQDSYTPIGQTSEYIGTSQISFSPSVVSSMHATFTPIKAFQLSLIGKYVGSQHYDNTNNKNNRLADYFICNAIAEYTFKIKNSTSINFQFLINNLLNKYYAANAWVSTDKFEDGSEIVYKGYYPQATRNIMFKANVSF